MPEPVFTALAAVAVVEPAAKAVAHLVQALKEPVGKRKIEQMRQELATAIEGLAAVITDTAQHVEHLQGAFEELQQLSETQQTVIQQQQASLAENESVQKSYTQVIEQQQLQIDELQRRVEHLSLPWWRRFVAKRPVV